MRSLARAALLAALLGGVFGEGTASGRAIGEAAMEIDLSVQAPAGGVVVAHLVESGGIEERVALREREAGIYGAVVEVPQVDLVVVFEALSPEPATSTPVSLTDLGLDRAVLGVSPPPERASEPGRRWWLVIGLGSGALAVVAMRAAGADRDGER